MKINNFIGNVGVPPCAYRCGAPCLKQDLQDSKDSQDYGVFLIEAVLYRITHAKYAYYIHFRENFKINRYSPGRFANPVDLRLRNML